MGVVGVGATIDFSTVFLLKSSGGTGSTVWKTADQDYKYAKSNIFRTVNGDNFDIYYETQYAGQVFKLNPKKTLPAKGNEHVLIWYPSDHKPSSGVILLCNGRNTSNNYCAIKNSKYRWTLQNNSFFGGTTEVDSIFTIYN